MQREYRLSSVQLTGPELQQITYSLERFIHNYVKKCVKKTETTNTHCPVRVSMSGAQEAAVNFMKYHFLGREWASKREQERKRDFKMLWPQHNHNGHKFERIMSPDFTKEIANKNLEF